MYHDRSDGVTLGLVLPPFDAPTRIYEAARVAEAHHFHSVWAPDATLPGYPWLDSLSVLGGIVAVTSSVQVGTSILVLARRNPVLLAHALASLDYLSGGRFILGVGVGERALRENEYAIAGVPMKERGRITEEYLALLQRLFCESQVTHEGPYFKASDVTVEPKPVRPDGIPFWVGGRSTASLRRAARFGAGWMPAMLTPADFRHGWAQLDQFAFEAGRDPADITGAIHIFASIGATYEAAVDQLAPGIEAIFRAPFANFEPLCLVGTAEQWLEQIGRFAEAGVRHVNILLYTRDLLGDVQLIGEQVVPHLRSMQLAH